MENENILIRKRGGIKAQLTRFQKYLDPIIRATVHDSATLSQISLLLDVIKPLLEEFNNLQQRLEDLQEEEDEETNYQERDSFESLYFTLLAQTQEIVRKFSTSSSSLGQVPVQRSGTLGINKMQISQVKLPTIQLPTFSGNYAEWLEFRDTFNSLIHGNPTIPNIQKFHYLKASLKSEAKDTILSLKICDNNYHIAWNALIERYDNKRLIVHNHIKSLFNLPSSGKKSHMALRQLLDGISKHLLALETLGQPIGLWDTLIIYIMTDKLDYVSKRDWEAYKIEGEFPTVDDFKTFLKGKCKMLETLNLSQPKISNISFKPKGSKPLIPELSTVLLATSGLTGANSIKEAITIREQLTEILEKGRLLPRLLWGPKADTLRYDIKENTTTSISKRVILSSISQIFDPLGLLGPSIVIPKVILQKLWQYKLTWNESIPLDLHTEWLRFQNELQSLRHIQIPRHVIGENATLIDLHGFCYASEMAYGACIYVCSVDCSGNTCIRLLCVNRIAPLKNALIPRLELCGALLLSKLVTRAKNSLNANINKIELWCNSAVVLSWIKTPPNVLKTFVANRVSKIQNLTQQENWNHVKSNDNPADLLSRGVSPRKLANSELWWNGPTWLANPFSEWPSSSHENAENSSVFLCEKRQQTTALINVENQFDLISKFSSLIKFQRVVAYCLRFRQNTLKPVSQRNLKAVSLQELRNSLQVLLKIAQNESFNQEILQLKQDRAIHSKSKLLSLNPFLDEHGILRVGGRLQNSEFDNDKKHTILLPLQHKLTDLIIKQEHERMLHSGPQALLASLRENYWPISGRNQTKKIVHSCVKCFRVKPLPTEYLMGPLPKDRITPASPFQHCGVDYCAPVLVKDRKGRGSKNSKTYICVFVCFATKAMHLELVSDLTSQALLACLRRFAARRGKPAKIYSGNGTNFVCTESEIKNLIKSLKNNDDLENALAAEGIIWKFIPPRSPHMGGLWEAGVKSVKYHLKRVVGNSSLTFEELYTILTQTEAVVNFRPLSPLTHDPNDPNPITPAHFLIGRRLTAVPDPNWMDTNENRLPRFQRVQQITQHFVAELQNRTKWKANHATLVQPGSMVVVREDNMPPLKWRLGRVIQTHAGTDDGVIRVVSIKCASGVQKRAISKLCVLPID